MRSTNGREQGIMIKWEARFVRLGLIVGAVASFAIAASAGLRWT